MEVSQQCTELRRRFKNVQADRPARHIHFTSLPTRPGGAALRRGLDGTRPVSVQRGRMARGWWRSLAGAQWGGEWELGRLRQEGENTGGGEGDVPPIVEETAEGVFLVLFSVVRVVPALSVALGTNNFLPALRGRGVTSMLPNEIRHFK